MQSQRRQQLHIHSATCHVSYACQLWHTCCSAASRSAMAASFSLKCSSRSSAIFATCRPTAHTRCGLGGLVHMPYILGCQPGASSVRYMQHLLELRHVHGHCLHAPSTACSPVVVQVHRKKTSVFLQHPTPTHMCRAVLTCNKHSTQSHSSSSESDKSNLGVALSTPSPPWH